jgi:hypothetical protein
VPDTKYHMVRVREDDFKRLVDAAKLLQQKGLESVDLERLNEQDFVPAPSSTSDDLAPLAALTLGLVVGIGAAAIGAMVAQYLAKNQENAGD